MPTIGTGTFTPQGQFSFPRSYVGNVAFPADWDLEGHTLHQFVFNDFRFYNDRIFCNLYSPLWAWSSNSYTLDHVVVDLFYHALPSTLDTPPPYTLKFLPATPLHAATLALTSPFFSTTLQYFPLPPVDQPYWLPGA